MKRRTKSILASASMVGALVGAVNLVGVTPASAEARCNSNGTPNWQSGMFTNNSNRSFIVQGDKLVNGAFQSVSYWIDPGMTAWGNAGICDSDFVHTPYTAWYYDVSLGYSVQRAPNYVFKVLGTDTVTCRPVDVGAPYGVSPWCRGA